MKMLNLQRVSFLSFLLLMALPLWAVEESEPTERDRILTKKLSEIKAIVLEQSKLLDRIQELYDKRFEMLEAKLSGRPGAAPAPDIAETIGKLEKEIQALREEQQISIAELEESQSKSIAQLSEEMQKTREQIAPIAFTPRVTMFGNLLGRVDDRAVISPEGDRVDDTFTLRAGEFELRAAIDPFADGFLTIPFEAETPTGPLEGDVEEGFVELKKLPFFEQPPWGLKLKMGKYRPDIGKNNRIHLHDLMWTTRPLPVSKFLGTEGLGESAEGGFQVAGINSEFFLPVGGQNTSVRMVVGYGSTGNLAATADFGRRPVFYLHPSFFQTVSENHNIELAASYLRGSSDEGEVERSTDLYGVDFSYNWQPARKGLWRSFISGGEFFFARQKEAQSERTPFGYFLFGQYQLNRSLYAGGRFDYSEELSDSDIATKVLAGYLSYYTSEFLRFRLGYEYRLSDILEDDHRSSVFFEVNFVFGAHPPEPYWVRR